MRYHLPTTRMAIIKIEEKNETKQKITSIEEDVEKLETSYVASRNAK